MDKPTPRIIEMRLLPAFLPGCMIALLAALFLGCGLQASPTPVTPSTVTVTTRPDGILVAPANFFTANGVNGGPGWIFIPSTGGVNSYTAHSGDKLAVALDGLGDITTITLPDSPTAGSSVTAFDYLNHTDDVVCYFQLGTYVSHAPGEMVTAIYDGATWVYISGLTSNSSANDFGLMSGMNAPGNINLYGHHLYGYPNAEAQDGPFLDIYDSVIKVSDGAGNDTVIDGANGFFTGPGFQLDLFAGYLTIANIQADGIATGQFNYNDSGFDDTVGIWAESGAWKWCDGVGVLTSNGGISAAGGLFTVNGDTGVITGDGSGIYNLPGGGAPDGFVNTQVQSDTRGKIDIHATGFGVAGTLNLSSTSDDNAGSIDLAAKSLSGGGSGGHIYGSDELGGTAGYINFTSYGSDPAGYFDAASYGDGYPAGYVSVRSGHGTNNGFGGSGGYFDASGDCNSGYSGGYVNVSAGGDHIYGGNGGHVDFRGGGDAPGGNIEATGNESTGGPGGYFHANGANDNTGGYITLDAGPDGPGGYFDASNGKGGLTMGLGNLTGPSSSGTILVFSSVPFSASASGTAGQIAYDSNFIYVCTATNTWKRAALSTW